MPVWRSPSIIPFGHFPAPGKHPDSNRSGIVFPPVKPQHGTVIELWHLPLLFLAALAAGFVDAIAGGGGLITLPVLLSCGIDPRVALGINKLQCGLWLVSAT